MVAALHLGAAAFAFLFWPNEEPHDDERPGAESQQGAEEGDAVGPAGDGDDHPARRQVQAAQAAPDLVDQRRRCVHGGNR